MRSSFCLLLLIGLAACKGTEPQPLGPLDSRIVEGEAQTVTAGAEPSSVIGLVFRNPLTGKFYQQQPPLWERVLLPAVAHALQVIGFQGVPNATYCIHNDGQTFVQAEKDCVQTDAAGNSRWDFNETTVAGTHTVIASATIGHESTVPDTMTFEVLSGPVDPNMKGNAFGTNTSPFSLFQNSVRDRYNNAVPFRVVSDGRFAVADSSLGSLDARTISFTPEVADSIYRIADITGAENSAIAQLRYRVIYVDGTAHMEWVACGLAVNPCVRD